ncbi:MAG: penicillin acylase family protein [Deinococcus sp.]|nr:penicillin acylase family protein [Deinococcus sp.]
MRRILLWIVAAVVLLGGISWTLLQPRYSGPGPQVGAEVVRDDWGVAYLFAENSWDLYFAQGYASAQDRIWQMDLWRRQGTGRLAEIEGRGKAVMDYRLRALRLEEVATALFAQLPPEQQEALEAYAAGVNWYLRQHHLPREFQLLHYRPQPWRPTDSLVVWRAMALMLSNLFDDSPGSLPSPIPSIGSNAWAVAPTRSATGRALLANDPHLPLTQPGPLWEVALNLGEEGAQGFALPGVPGLVIGRNRHLAWGLTAFEGDVADQFFCRWGQEQRRYRTDHGLGTIDAQRPIVWVRLWGPLRVPVFWQAVEYTEFGPVLERTRRGVRSLRWAGAQALPDERLVTVEVWRATSVAQLQEAAGGLGVPDMNIIAADDSGNIAHLVRGRFPRRQRFDTPRDCEDPKLGWQGFVDPSELPTVINPPGGFVASANGAPPVSTGVYLGRGWPYARQERISELLAANSQHSLNSFGAIQADVLVPGAQEQVRDLLASVDTSRLDSTALQALELLRAWDQRATADSIGTSLFQVWSSYGRGLGGLTQTLGFLRQRLGPDPATWRWDRLHAAVLPHELARLDPALSVGPLPRQGDGHTVDPGPGQADLSAPVPFRQDFGAVLRLLAEVGGDARAVLAVGETGDPSSPHYADQGTMWAQNQYRTLAPLGSRPNGGVTVLRP